MSLEEQIQILKQKKNVLENKVDELEGVVKSSKKELAIVGKAITQLEKLEGQLNEATDIPD